MYEKLLLKYIALAIMLTILNPIGLEPDRYQDAAVHNKSDRVANTFCKAFMSKNSGSPGEIEIALPRPTLSSIGRKKRRARPRRKGLAQIRRRLEGVAFPLPVNVFNIFGSKIANEDYLKHLLVQMFYL